MEPKADAAGKAVKKLSFCLFCMYLGSNDPSYMNHIICGHNNANYRCRKCLKEVFTTGQPLKNHIKVCKGLPKEAANEGTAGDADCTHTMLEKKKHMSKDPSPDLQPPPPQSSQGSSQVSPHWSQHAKKKPALTPKKSDSSHREEEHSSHHKHCSRDKSGEKSRWTNTALKSPTRSLARNPARSPARSPARRSTVRRRNLGRKSGTTMTRPGRISPARSELAPPSMGSTLTTSTTYGHSYQVVLHVILDVIVTCP